MKAKPKPLQYASRARRIPRRIASLERQLKSLDVQIDLEKSLAPDIIDAATRFSERSKQQIRNRIDALRERFNELERLGYASVTLFLLALI